MRLSFGWLCFLICSAATASESPGPTVYTAKCAFCHGASGEGTKKYPVRLEGDKSPAQLAEVIRKTMPENDPESLTAAEARAVAEYVHSKFYSPVARERNRPARIELSRLTARQHRNSLADVIASFRRPAVWTNERGLKAEYFKKRGFNPADRVAERIDPQVAFDFGTSAPIPEKMEAQEFAIRWNGSLLAPDTGEYEFTIRTEHATRLWINNPNQPTVDAWVKSGPDTEHKGSVFLLGGRVYPVRLEYSKAKQGVNDSKKGKTPPPTRSSISLMWSAPGRPLQVIPDRHLCPSQVTESYSCTTRFPPDDRSYGWERGNTVSKEWDAATTAAAFETVNYVAAHLEELAGLGAPARRRTSRNVDNPSNISLDADSQQPADQDRSRRIRTFAERFAEIAFRRPLSAEQKALIEKIFAVSPDPETAAKRVTLWALKSPRFLYREVDSRSDSHDVASRLSFAVWDSIPDAELLRAAAGGKLSTPEQVRKQAERMVALPAGREKLRKFLLTWLHADAEHDLNKDPARFPGFDATLAADLRTSLEIFLEDVAWSDSSDFRQLLLSENFYVNERVADFYDIECEATEKFQKVSVDPGRHAGVLTHPYLMSIFSHGAESSPIHRGVFVARGLLGISLKPPPEAVAPLAAELHPSLTTRERVILQTNASACATCHGVINPLGFVLENYDAVGRFRDAERDKPIDASGMYLTRGGETVTIKGPKALADFLAGSEEVHDAFCEQMFHYYTHQPVRAYGPNTSQELRSKFAAGKFSIRNLAIEVATTAALTPRAKP